MKGGTGQVDECLTARAAVEEEPVRQTVRQTVREGAVAAALETAMGNHQAKSLAVDQNNASILVRCTLHYKVSLFLCAMHFSFFVY